MTTQMKTTIALIIMTLFLASCHTNISKRNGQNITGKEQGAVNVDGLVSLGLNKTSYSVNDTITINILNKSDEGIELSLRCGTYLEMSYEKMEGEEWSGKREPWYMNLKCMTRMQSLGPGKSYTFSLPAGKIGEVGSYRFKVPFITSGESHEIRSLEFRIKD